MAISFICAGYQGKNNPAAANSLVESASGSVQGVIDVKMINSANAVGESVGAAAKVVDDYLSLR